MAKMKRTLCLNFGCINNRYDSCIIPFTDGDKEFYEQMYSTKEDYEKSCTECDYYDYVGGFFDKNDAELAKRLKNKWIKDHLDENENYKDQ